MRETDILEPDSYYAVTKSAQTLLCSHVARQEKKPIVTIRPFSVYGPYEEPKRFVPTLMNALFSNKKMNLVSPTTARDFVYVDDIVFSGKMVNKLFMRTAINIIRKCGYKIQSSKIKSFSKNSPKLITGVVIKDLQPFIKNEHHKEIYKIRTEIKQSKKLDDRIGKLKGKLNAAGQIEPIFKQYAKSKLREVIEKV